MADLKREKRTETIAAFISDLVTLQDPSVYFCW